jgi:hypothetical protein
VLQRRSRTVVASHGTGDTLDLTTEQIELVDTNSDGAVDSSTVFRLKDRLEFGPLFLETPRHGALQLEVRGTIGSVIQAWRSDEEGNVLALLGTANIVYATSSAIITLGAPLVEGDHIVLRDTTLDVDGFAREVEEAIP